MDQKGEYLIVEGDELILGNEPEESFSNFYFSQINSKEDVQLENYKNGQTFLAESTGYASMSYCGDVMNSLSNPDGFTQYSTIYDLEKLIVSVYLFHDYSQYVEIDLKEELEESKHRMMIAELFSSDAPGYKNYMLYNNKEYPTGFLDEFVLKFGEKKTEEELIKNGFNINLNLIGYEWLNDKNDVIGAIEIFKYGVNLMPGDGNLHDSLGEAYYKNKDYDSAIMSYSNALRLDPENDNAKEMLQKIKKEKKAKSG